MGNKKPAKAGFKNGGLAHRSKTTGADMGSFIMNGGFPARDYSGIARLCNAINNDAVMMAALGRCLRFKSNVFKVTS